MLLPCFVLKFFSFVVLQKRFLFYFRFFRNPRWAALHQGSTLCVINTVKPCRAWRESFIFLLLYLSCDSAVAGTFSSFDSFVFPSQTVHISFVWGLTSIGLGLDGCDVVWCWWDKFLTAVQINSIEDLFPVFFTGVAPSTIPIFDWLTSSTPSQLHRQLKKEILSYSYH